MTRCNGQDPAYPGLACYLDVEHNQSCFSYECEFMTEETGLAWREKARKLDELIRSWRAHEGVLLDDDGRVTILMNKGKGAS